MFGTTRTVEDIWLRIYCHADEDSNEICEAWGCVSYTMELDFRNETQNDTLQYTLVVKPSTFARYVEYMSSGNIDFIYFSASHVAGIYSEWSPGISTHRIKILTADKEHKIEGDGQAEIELPRLREVGDWSLEIVRKPTLRTQFILPPKDGRMNAPAEIIAPQPDMPMMSAPTDPETKKAFQSMKQAAWWAVALLAILAVKAVLH